jgi:SHS2 domain-containing protein
VQKDFEIIDHTADVGIVAYGDNIGQAFGNAARALFSLITELDSVAEVVCRDTELSAVDEESLLVAWLNELIYLFDTENIVFNRFDVAVLPGVVLRARSYGEKVDESKHRLKTGVKAATYHMLRVEKDNGCRVRVILDI